jgi:hypothetical protein
VAVAAVSEIEAVLTKDLADHLGNYDLSNSSSCTLRGAGGFVLILILNLN